MDHDRAASRARRGTPLTRRQLLAGMGVGAAAVHAHWLLADRALAAGGENWACEVPVAASRTGVAEPPPSGPPELVGQWSPSWLPRFDMAGVHAVVLHTGWILLIRGTRGYLWDPIADQYVSTTPPADVFCGGQCVLGDGRVLFAGGRAGRNPYGTRALVTFDPVAVRWEVWPQMRRGRWYPTATTLPDGTAVVTSGMAEDGATLNPDIEHFDGATVRVVGRRVFELYPKQFVLPDGRILVAGPEPRDTVLLGTDFSRTAIDRLRERHHNGGAVLLPGGPDGSWTVLVVGGNGTRSAAAGGPTTRCELLDLTHPSGQWRDAAPLPEPRVWENVVQLPDGTALCVGGGNVGGATRQALRYDPAADTWTPMATQAESRRYHSTAVLLPDGRVLSAGDTTVGGGSGRLDVYSPPYLFRGPRPTVTAAPEQVAWGQAFTVTTPDPVTRAVLMRPAATTHALDMDQRHVELAFTQSGGTLTVTAPPSGGVAPAGWYLLFLLNDLGVPSVGRFMRVGPA